jgi:hypothetical protein
MGTDNSFHVGQRVVCVDDSDVDDTGANTGIRYLRRGRLYTVTRTYVLSSGPGVNLQEIDRPYSYEGFRVRTRSAGDRARRRHLGLYSRARNHKQISRCSLTPLTLRPVFPTSAACSDQWGEAFIAGLKRRSPGVWVTTGASPASMLAFAGPAP